MASRLLEIFRLGRCSHQFSWPRRWPDGDHYQVCLLCGEEFRYDWQHMRRSGPLDDRPGEAVDGDRHRSRRKRWSPRARRIRLHDQEVLFRENGTRTWHEGWLENISSSGVLFRTHRVLREDTEIEMILGMPEEICGQKDSRVLARGMVVRFVQPTLPTEMPALAAGIWDYKFLDHPDQFSLGPV